MLCATIYIFFLLFCTYFLYDCIKPANFPPGPAWLPILGCFPAYKRLREKCGYTHLVFKKWTQIYGPILGLKLGNQRIVVVSSYELVKKALLQEDFNGRPDGFFFRIRAFGKRKGVLFTEGHTWSQCRRFTMRHLRSFGLGQSLMKDRLTNEARSLIDYLRRESENGAVVMHTAFDVAVLNSLWIMFAGHRFEYDDEKLREILKTVHDAFKVTDTMGGILSQLPFLRFVIPELSGYNELMRILKKLWEFMEEEIEQHEISLCSDEPRDLIEAFLLEQTSHEGTNDIFDRENLLVLCLDLFLAGSKTTTDTLASIILFLSLNPKWMRILQDELDSVTGKTRAPMLEDSSALPVVEAFLAEAQRFLILAPLGVPHKTMKNVWLNGYKIPKDTIVLFDYYSVHNDQDFWAHPEEFRPERFLDKNGKFCQNNASIPFGLGKRRCLGETLARSSLFLFFVYFLHTFNIRISPFHGKPDPRSYDGFTLSPRPYYLELYVRSNVKY